jgi:hypothetical protein
MPVQLLEIQFPKDIKHLINERTEPYEITAFEEI